MVRRFGSWRGYCALVLGVASASCGETARSRGTATPPPGSVGQGGEVAGEPAAGGAEAAGQGGTGAVGTSSGGTGANGMGAAGMMAAGGTPDCSLFSNASPAAVSVRIVNSTQSTIHLGPQTINCAAEPLYQVRDHGGMLLSPPGSCASCQDVMSGSFGCPFICSWTPAVTLKPGESLEQTWLGLASLAVDALPEACLRSRPPPESSSRCWRSVAQSPGEFTFSAHAGSTLGCGDPAAASCGPCQPNAEGGCITIQGVVPMPTLGAETTLTLSAADLTQGPGSGQSPKVELVFKD